MDRTPRMLRTRGTAVGPAVLVAVLVAVVVALALAVTGLGVTLTLQIVAGVAFGVLAAAVLGLGALVVLLGSD